MSVAKTGPIWPRKSGGVGRRRLTLPENPFPRCPPKFCQFSGFRMGSKLQVADAPVTRAGVGEGRLGVRASGGAQAAESAACA